MRFLALALVLAACINDNKSHPVAKQKEAPVARAPAGPPQPIVWSGFQFVDGTCKVSVVPQQLSYQMLAESCPPGTEITLGDQKTTVKGQYDTLSHDATAELAEASVLDLMGLEKQYAGKVPVTVLFPDGRNYRGTVPPTSFSMAVSEKMKEVAKHSLPLPGDELDKGPPDSIYLADTMPDVVGRAGKLREVDWVAVVDGGKQTAVKKCGGYTGGKTLDVTFVESAVHVYDRRTGALVKETAIAPQQNCPMFVTTWGGSNTTSVRASNEAVLRWLRTQLKR